MLRKVAILADPMLRPRREAVRQWIAQACEADAAVAGTPLNRHHLRVLDAVSEIVGDG